MLMVKTLISANIGKYEELGSVESNEVESIYFTHATSSDLLEHRGEINDLCVDVLLVMTNSESAVGKLKEKGIKNAMLKMHERLKENENLSDRLLVICNYLQM